MFLAAFLPTHVLRAQGLPLGWYDWLGALLLALAVVWLAYFHFRMEQEEDAIVQRGRSGCACRSSVAAAGPVFARYRAPPLLCLRACMIGARCGVRSRHRGADPRTTQR